MNPDIIAQQASYRELRLHLPPGSGPNASNRRLQAYMLPKAYGERGLNFVARHIFQIAQRRLAEPKALPLDRFKLLCNLASPAALAINLFGPLVDDRQAANAIFSALAWKPVSVEALHLIWAPQPPSAYLNDLTHFSACALLPEGFVAFVLPFGEPAPARVALTPQVSDLARRAGSPWPESAWPFLATPRLVRLWRVHLLAEALAQTRPEAHLVIAPHPLDREAQEALAHYRSLIQPGKVHLHALGLEDLVAHFQAALSGSPHAAWLNEFTRRYLDPPEPPSTAQAG